MQKAALRAAESQDVCVQQCSANSANSKEAFSEMQKAFCCLRDITPRQRLHCAETLHQVTV